MFVKDRQRINVISSENRNMHQILASRSFFAKKVGRESMANL